VGSGGIIHIQSFMTTGKGVEGILRFCLSSSLIWLKLHDIYIYIYQFPRNLNNTVIAATILEAVMLVLLIEGTNGVWI
jgi:hypothetical protein